MLSKLLLPAPAGANMPTRWPSPQVNKPSMARTPGLQTFADRLCGSVHWARRAHGILDSAFQRSETVDRARRSPSRMFARAARGPTADRLGVAQMDHFGLRRNAVEIAERQQQCRLPRDPDDLGTQSTTGSRIAQLSTDRRPAPPVRVALTSVPTCVEHTASRFRRRHAGECLIQRSGQVITTKLPMHGAHGINPEPAAATTLVHEALVNPSRTAASCTSRLASTGTKFAFEHARADTGPRVLHHVDEIDVRIHP